MWGTALLCGGFFAAAFLPGWAGWGFFLAFSIPAGLGTAFLYPSIQSCAQKWYKGRKCLATGGIGGAVGLSGAFLTVFVRTALRGFGPVQGIRGAFWALGALTLPVCLAGSALLTDPPPEKPQPSQQGKAKAAPPLDLSPRQMLGTRQNWLCAGAVCFSTPAVLLCSPIILKLGMERGLDENAALRSVVLGSVVALVRVAHDQQRRGHHAPALAVANAVCKLYATVIRGTPMMVQLLIMSMAIFNNSRNFTMVGPLTLGINSGAYVSEIIRGGLMAVDPGQMEAGRSLGLNYMTTMVVIVIPQAIRAVLPALGNEFIVLLKDTSLITVIGGKELLYAAQGIMNRTYEAMFPLCGVALIYLVLVMIFTWLLAKFERRLAQSDR